MMRRRRSRVQGVLSDFDPTVDTRDLDMKGNSQLHRTGTLLFLSMSLLEQLGFPKLYLALYSPV